MSKSRSLILMSMVLPLLAAAALLGAFTALAAPNATITVTNRFDSGAGSLRQAIADANSGDTINFAADLSGQSIPLVFELSIDKSLTISGSVPITVSGRNATRVFNVTAGNVTFDSLTIRNGNVQTNDCGTTFGQCGGGIMIQNSGVAVTITNSILISNTADSYGGGIYSSGGTLTVTDSNLSDNAAGSEGGGIYSNGALTVTNSTLSDNAAGSEGGGIYNDGALMVNDSTLSGNSARRGSGIYNGGGIFSHNPLTLNNSTLSGNSATDDGGGIYNNGGSTTINNSTLSGNSATDDGGGIYNDGALTVNNSTLSDNSATDDGGGIHNNQGTVTVDNSTLYGNSATDDGGGIYSSGFTSGSRLTVNNSTLISNRASIYGGGGIYHNNGTFHLHNTILANSHYYYDCVSTNVLSTDINNLIEVNNGCGTPVSNDDPVLGPLQDNGGDTWTQALLLGSPAIDAGDNATCLAADQRGIARPQNTSCDIGAFESHGFTLSLSGGTPQTTGINTAFAAPLALTVTSTVGEPVEGGKVTFAAPDSGAGLTFTEAVATVGSDGAVSMTVTANGTVGSYQITAFANGNSGSPVTYILTNAPVYMLTVQLDGNGSGSVSSTPAGIDCGTDCSEWYSDITVVTLTATADIGSTFTGWGGACSGTATCEVTMDAAKNVTATFTLDTHELTVSLAGTGSGSVSSTPAGIVCGTDCSETYDYGTVVTLTANADTGSTFTGWGGACSGTATCEVTMDAAKNVTATFTLDTHELTVSLAGTGSGSVSSTPAGIVCGTDCSETYDYGTVVTLTASADTGSTFTGWGGACSGIAACEVTMDAAKNVTATFTLDTHELTVNLAGTGSGNISSTPAGIVCGTDCSEIYSDRTVVTLTATANPFSTFTGWGGACSGTAACVITMDAEKNVTAIFTLDTHELTVSRAGTGSGSVSSTPAGIVCGTDCSETYDYVTVVTLTATADTGSTFTGWGGACSGTSACVVIMYEEKSVTATFMVTYDVFFPVIMK